MTAPQLHLAVGPSYLPVVSKACVDCRYSGAMLIGYARVSTDNQETAAQVAALKSAGCERIYREKAFGDRWDRPELQEILAQVRKGDVLVVWKIDRLSRSLRDLLSIMERLGEADCGSRKRRRR